tara:strand:+ start:729 stop:1985 length:1257 start_codon:yes stop_codon:yes gene_type:complete
MVPSGWERKTLNKVAEIRTGVAKGKKGLKDPIEVSYLRVANVQDGKIDLSEVKSIQIERHQLDRYSLKKGDVLMTEGGDFDKLGRGDVWQGQIEPCLNQNHVFAVRVDPNKLLPYFLTTLSSSYYGKTYFLSCAKRTTNLASINSSQLKDFPVLLPPLPEQRQIAQILSTWDKAIVTTEKLIAASQQQKKALMQQLLTGKKRFAGFSEAWEEVKLGDIATYSKGYTYKSDEYSESQTEYGFLTLKSILRGGGYSERGIKYLRSPVENKFSVEQGDIVFAVTDLTRNAEVVGAPILIPDLPYGKSFISMDLVKLKVAQSVNKEFFFYLMQSSDNRNFMRARASGSTVLHLDIKGSKQLKLKIPKNLTEQQKIAAVLTSSDQEINALQSKLAHLKQEKKALMQQLLTGKRRVVLEAETSL